MVKKNNLYAVILAGGSGTRFWPLSRAHWPKQFLPLVGSKTLFQETLARVRSRVPADQIFIVTNRRFAGVIRRQSAGVKIPAANCLLEPSGKNTAPAICWAAALIAKRNPRAVMMVLPSDHLIQNRNNFNRVLGQAVRLAERDFLVTLGIVPTRPETGYGYIQAKPEGGIYRAARFIEKPPRKKAEEFLRKGHFLWNSGMFVWKCSTVLEEYRQYLPAVRTFFETNGSPAAVRRNWARLPAVSVDYGIMERSRRVAVVPAQNIGWSDVGSWEALWEVLGKTGAGNAVRGDVAELGCRNSLVFAGKKLVAAVGLDDVVIVDTPDALLVCRKDQSQRVKEIVEMLKSKKRGEI